MYINVVPTFHNKTSAWIRNEDIFTADRGDCSILYSLLDLGAAFETVDHSILLHH